MHFGQHVSKTCVLYLDNVGFESATVSATAEVDRLAALIVCAVDVGTVSKQELCAWLAAAKERRPT